MKILCPNISWQDFGHCVLGLKEPAVAAAEDHAIQALQSPVIPMQPL
jgi:hypothetical protein